MTDAERLAEARDALHRLQLGEAEVSIRASDGRMLTYQPASAKELRAYIAELSRATGSASGRYRAIRPIF